MRSALSTIVLVLVFTAMGALSQGQGAPGQIDAALLDLSARLGYSVGIGNLSNWRWEQTNFPDDSLGCPTASGSGGGVIGYQFRLTHNAITYDYRISADSALVIYCGQIDPAAAAARPETPYSNRLCSDTAAGGPYMRSRINVGMDIEVLSGFLNLRGQPSLNGQVLLQIPAGRSVRVTAGPDCVDGYVWWLVVFNGQTGYIAEAGAGSYFVQPEAPPAMPSREVLNTHLVSYLLEFGTVSGNFQPEHAWSSDNVYLAMPGARGSDSVWLYDLRHQPLGPQILEHEGGISTLEFRPNSAQFVFGSETGALHLWQIDAVAESGYKDRLFLNAHAGAVSALAFSADGERPASAGDEAYTHVPVERKWAAIVWDLPTVAQQAILSGHSGLIRHLAFSPNGSVIASAADDNQLIFREPNTGAILRAVTLSAPVTALDYSPDGQLLALALARSADNLELYNPATWTRLASYPVPTNNVTAVDFSPDGSMLVAGAAEGIFSVWDTRSHQLLTTRETDGAVRDISFSPDGTLITVSTEKHALIFYGVPLGSG